MSKMELEQAQCIVTGRPDLQRAASAVRSRLVAKEDQVENLGQETGWLGSAEKMKSRLKSVSCLVTI